ncbi:uncharacterized protein LOC142345902 isoform X2 [Convolutriloba macropyga]|uniref:uncharacterized protein LOC142345902 isoform X2 n=1 Tax=Convolutriloba macropyga TaxID=536237 RepID=UPI003F5239BA
MIFFGKGKQFQISLKALCPEVKSMDELLNFPLQQIEMTKQATKMQMYQMKLFYLCCRNVMMIYENTIWFPECWNQTKIYLQNEQHFLTKWTCLEMQNKTDLNSELYATCSDTVELFYYTLEKNSFCKTPMNVQRDIATVIIYLLGFIFVFILILFFVGKDRSKY